MAALLDSEIVDCYKSSQVFPLLEEPIDLDRHLKVAISVYPPNLWYYPASSADSLLQLAADTQESVPHTNSLASSKM